jgi:hypothetical protein
MKAEKRGLTGKRTRGNEPVFGGVGGLPKRARRGKKRAGWLFSGDGDMLMLEAGGVMFVGPEWGIHEGLAVFQEDYPWAFFFRASESFAANSGLSYVEWEEAFERLMGIEGKVLEEEVPGWSIRNGERISLLRRWRGSPSCTTGSNGASRERLPRTIRVGHLRRATKPN